jgi:hypothetical protein
LGHFKRIPNDEKGKEEGGESHSKYKQIKGEGVPILQKNQSLRKKCFWNPNNLKNKQEVIVNEMVTQQIRQGNWKKEKP